MPFVVTCSVDIKIAVAHVVTQPFFSTAKDMSAFLVERKKKKRTISVLYYSFLLLQLPTFQHIWKMKIHIAISPGFSIMAAANGKNYYVGDISYAQSSLLPP